VLESCHEAHLIVSDEVTEIARDGNLLLAAVIVVDRAGIGAFIPVTIHLIEQDLAFSDHGRAVCSCKPSS
jgi:hypothetical protein